MITLYGTERKKFGTSYSRKLRLKNNLPSIVYGKQSDILFIKLKQNDIINLFNKKNCINKNITLIINKKKIKVIFKEIQRHPYKYKFLHIDFLRI
ncbi:50S ribosomal protein L25 [Buchnera aphidicola (Periphyllus koelreuteriae)]|uniref:50S ribosomal protein L25 n=1 Tax=Buchnera aphidicola TaxID=9 RepID=UPI0031B80057